MSSSRKSGSVSWNSRRHSALLRETCCARRAGLPDAEEPDPVEALLGQVIQFGVGNVVQGRRRPRFRDNSVSQTRVLIWYRDGLRGFAIDDLTVI